MKVLPILPASATDDVIRKALKDRDMSPAMFDQIEYNWGRGAAITAMLSGKQRYHNHVPGEVCQCS